jgi:hypothetical protein
MPSNHAANQCSGDHLSDDPPVLLSFGDDDLLMVGDDDAVEGNVLSEGPYTKDVSSITLNVETHHLYPGNPDVIVLDVSSNHRLKCFL